MPETNGLESAVRAYIRDTVAASAFSRLDLLGNIPVADEPLVGFADGLDPVMGQFKTVVGSHHMTPSEAWKRAFPGAPQPQRLSVIAFVLPFSLEIRKSNRNRREPSAEWVQGKAYCEAMLNELRDGLVRFLAEKGFHAVAPTRMPDFHVEYNTPSAPTSNWSERHYCYAAGLGTFGLSRSLITARGSAMRCGSVVVDAALPATPRPTSHTAYCAFLEAGGCGDCIDRCPAKAITVKGKDNRICERFLNDTLLPLARELVPEEVVRRTSAGKLPTVAACGLCQTDVPCEYRVPPPSLFKPTRR